jgi:acetoin utilization protein AcuB
VRRAVSTARATGAIVLPVREIMTHPVITVSADATLGDARRLLDEHRMRHLPVVVNGRLVGIVSDRDVRSSGAVKPAAIAVGDIMTRQPITVTSATRVEDAARLLIDHKIGGLPVVDGEELTGIVTGDDLLRALVALIETATVERISIDFAEDRDA